MFNRRGKGAEKRTTFVKKRICNEGICFVSLVESA
jgi:hypothetical protein